MNRFFAAHVLVLPLITAILMLAHFLFIRKQGISSPRGRARSMVLNCGLILNRLSCSMVFSKCLVPEAVGPVLPVRPSFAT